MNCCRTSLPWTAWLIVALSVVLCAGSVWADGRDFETRVVLRDTTRGAAPPPPPGADGLVLDDGSWEGSFTVTSGGSSLQFLWFNQFAAPSLPFRLNQIWVLFPAASGVPVGGSIQLGVWLDADGDPSNGATLLRTVDTTVQVADGVTFSVYSLGPPLLIVDPGDVLIGVVPRFIESGVTPDTVAPAALDTTSSQGRSWFAVWAGDPPDPLALPPDTLLSRIDDIGQPGNWMIRAYGEAGVPEPGIPAAGAGAVSVLILLIAAAGALVLRLGR